MTALILRTLWKPLAALLALLGIYAKGRADSSTKTRIRTLENDNEAASNLRRAVDLGLPDRLRKFDDAGFRD